MTQEMIYIACRSCTSGYHATTGPCRLHDGNGAPCACRVCNGLPEAGPPSAVRSWAWFAGVAVLAASALIVLGMFAWVVIAAVAR